ncbi:MAG: hypothetical protein QM296_07230 [Bacillota bacterium]|nr:hypothetical protein [Bacillota bacterium]
MSEIGAGTKKLTTAGQKLRWCPESGQERKNCPQMDSILYCRYRQIHSRERE